MLQTGLSHGVAIMPNAPKERFSDPNNGAHFDFYDMCSRLEKMAKRRYIEQCKKEKKVLNKDFMNVDKEIGGRVENTEKVRME